MAGSPKEEITFSLWRGLRLIVSTRTDIIALVAFILAVGAAISQFSAWYLGPELRIYMPKTITFDLRGKFDPQVIGRKDQNYLRVAAKMAYANGGAVGYDASVFEETITLRFHNGKEISLGGKYFATTSARNTELLQLENPTEIQPFVVGAGKGLGHETIFIPEYQLCEEQDNRCKYINWMRESEFAKLLKQPEPIHVTLQAHLFGGDIVRGSCLVRINSKDQEKFRERGWLSSYCVPDILE